MEQASNVGKAELTPDRVWARRAARHTVAFGCSDQTTGAGGESGEGWGGAGCTCPHHPTRAVHGPLWPPIAPPAQLPLHQRVRRSPAPNCSEWRVSGCIGEPDSDRRSYLCVLCPWPPCTLHPAHLQCTLTNNCPNSQNSRLILFKEILKYAQNMEIYGYTMHTGLDFDNNVVYFGLMYSRPRFRFAFIRRCIFLEDSNLTRQRTTMRNSN